MNKVRRDWGQFALLLIDVQQDFWPQRTAESFPEFPAKVTRLLALCRNEGLEVIHLRARFKAELTSYLQQRGKRFVLTAGLITSVCVFLTTASAAQLGFLAAVVEDCCADEPFAHEHTLDRYQFIFDRTTTDSICDHHAQWVAALDKLDAPRSRE